MSFKSFVKSNLLLTLSINFGNFANYLIQYLLSYYLTLELFAKFNLINSWVAIFSIPSTVITYFFIKIFSDLNKKNNIIEVNEFIFNSVFKIFIIYLICSPLFVIFYYYDKSFQLIFLIYIFPLFVYLIL